MTDSPLAVGGMVVLLTHQPERREQLGQEAATGRRVAPGWCVCVRRPEWACVLRLVPGGVFTRVPLL